jgi:transcriptional regulator with XRE-family HTH domain
VGATKEEIGGRVKLACKTRGITQRALGIAIGIAPENAQQWADRYLNARRAKGLPAHDLVPIARELNVSLEWLLTGEGRGPTDSIEDTDDVRRSIRRSARPVDVNRIAEQLNMNADQRRALFMKYTEGIEGDGIGKDVIEQYARELVDDAADSGIPSDVPPQPGRKSTTRAIAASAKSKRSAHKP